MAEPVKPRSYHSPLRREAARRTRHAILQAAGELFQERGYAATTMTAVAERAGVALDTVYESVGRKPMLFRLLVETAISGEDEPVPALEREYVKAMRAETSAGRKLDVYATAVATIMARLAPLLQVVREAAAGEPSLAELWRQISERRAGNMRLLAADLAATGELRPELPVDEAADVIWATNSPELYLLLVGERGWEPERYQRWLAATWRRLLLAPTDGGPSQ